jgi:hypothetical protein
MHVSVVKVTVFHSDLKWHYLGLAIDSPGFYRLNYSIVGGNLRIGKKNVIAYCFL